MEIFLHIALSILVIIAAITSVVRENRLKRKIRLLEERLRPLSTRYNCRSTDLYLDGKPIKGEVKFHWTGPTVSDLFFKQAAHTLAEDIDRRLMADLLAREVEEFLRK